MCAAVSVNDWPVDLSEGILSVALEVTSFGTESWQCSILIFRSEIIAQKMARE